MVWCILLIWRWTAATHECIGTGTSSVGLFVYCESEDSLLKKQRGVLWQNDKIFVLLEERPWVLKTFHNHQLARHFRAHKTVELIQQSFWWPNVNQDCRIYVKSCTICLYSKGDKTKETKPIPNRSWEMIVMDFIVDLPPSEGFTTILVEVN